MTVACPSPNCQYTGDTINGFLSHWGYNHDGSVKEQYPEFDTSLPQEQADLHQERMLGNNIAKGYERTDEQWENLEKGQKMNPSDEWKENRSEEMKGNNHGRRNCFFVDELGHEVDSNWEMDISFLLKENNFDYELEPEYDRSAGRSYFPDFQIDDVVIEVKGWASDDAVAKAEEFMERHDETYVVVGDEMPCDYYISWENRGQLIRVLNNLVNQ